MSNTAHLGSGTSGFESITKPADAGLLQVFPNKMPPGSVIQLGGFDDPKEFTSLCPKTGQPDFGRIVVRYWPRDCCIESKSWKLYLGSYRNESSFHEECVSQIMRDLVSAADPWRCEVEGQFTPRGGISINPKTVFQKAPEDLPKDLVLFS